MFFVGTTRVHCLPTCLAYKWLRLMVDVFQMVLEAILYWHFDGTLWTLDLLLFFNGQPTTLLMFPQGSNIGVTFAAAFIFTLIRFLLAVYIEMALQRLGTWHFGPTDLTNKAILMKLHVLHKVLLEGELTCTHVTLKYIPLMPPLMPGEIMLPGEAFGTAWIQTLEHPLLPHLLGSCWWRRGLNIRLYICFFIWMLFLRCKENNCRHVTWNSLGLYRSAAVVRK